MRYLYAQRERNTNEVCVSVCPYVPTSLLENCWINFAEIRYEHTQLRPILVLLFKFTIKQRIEVLKDIQHWLKQFLYVQGGSNMTGTDLCVNKPHCTAAVRP